MIKFLPEISNSIEVAGKVIAAALISVDTDYRGFVLAVAAEHLMKQNQGYTASVVRRAAAIYDNGE